MCCMRVLKWIAIAAVAVILVAIGYLSLQPDPGPYIVALRSDTPEQVSVALDAILTGDTEVIYQGRPYPPVPTDKLDVLGARYMSKAMGMSGEPLKGDTVVWVGFVNRIVSTLNTRARRP